MIRSQGNNLQIQWIIQLYSSDVLWGKRRTLLKLIFVSLNSEEVRNWKFLEMFVCCVCISEWHCTVTAHYRVCSQCPAKHWRRNCPELFNVGERVTSVFPDSRRWLGDYHVETGRCQGDHQCLPRCHHAVLVSPLTTQ